MISSLQTLKALGLPFIFSDRHAYLAAAQFYSDMAGLNQIDWDLLQRRDFKRDSDGPAKVERYQAEALVRDQVPVEALLGITCYDKAAHDRITTSLESAGVNLKIAIRPNWYF